MHHSHKSEPKTEIRFYLNKGLNHLRDRMKVLTLSSTTRNTRDVTCETQRVPVIAVAPPAG